MTWTRNMKPRLFILLFSLLVVAPAVAMALDAARTTSPEITLRALEPQFVFIVERNGEVLGYFTECSGIGSETEVIEFRDGADPNIVHKIPGVANYGDVTLKRGITADLGAWNWRAEVLAGTAGFSSAMTIKMLGRDGAPIAQWNFENAWPSKVSGPQMRSESEDISIEELTIVHERVDRIR